jgi:hypothetical protein
VNIYIPSVATFRTVRYSDIRLGHAQYDDNKIKLCIC